MADSNEIVLVTQVGDLREQPSVPSSGVAPTPLIIKYLHGVFEGLAIGINCIFADSPVFKSGRGQEILYNIFLALQAEFIVSWQKHDFPRMRLDIGRSFSSSWHFCKHPVSLCLRALGLCNARVMDWLFELSITKTLEAQRLASWCCWKVCARRFGRRQITRLSDTRMRGKSA
jgi:hypothetical protein